MDICLVVGHTGHFIRPALPELMARGHLVRKDQRTELEVIRRNLRESDVVLCEWLSRKAVQYSKQHGGRAKLVIRAHEGEMVNAPRRCRAVNWRNVDLLLMPSPGMYPLLTRIVPAAKKVPVRFVGNPIDTDKFKLLKRTYGHTLGMLGRVTPKKGNVQTIEWYRELSKQDARYHLEMRGWKPDSYGGRVKRVAKGLRRVRFGGRVGDLQGWYAGIDLIISMSRREAFHVVIAEAMATGCYPVVLDWPEARGGAKWVYPKWALVRQRKDWIRNIRRWGAESAEKKMALSKKAQQWIVDHHGVDKFVDRVVEALESVL